MASDQLESEKILDTVRQKLQLIEAFRAVTVKFNGKQFPAETKEQIITEIKKYVEGRIREIDTGVKQSQTPQLQAQNIFNPKQIEVLRQLADKAMSKGYTVSDVPREQQEDTPPELVSLNIVPLQPATQQSVDILAVTMRDGIGKAMYNGVEVKIMANRNGKTVIKMPNGQKTVVDASTLEAM